MYFIGDVHGFYKPYKKLIHSVPNSIQVGDMGVGFRSWPHEEPKANPPYDEMVASGARFIRGNHDNPSVCKRHSQYIPDGFVQSNMMFVGGASSIDKAYRVEDYSWWPDEECNTDEMHRISAIYVTALPEIMVTHDCPVSIIALMHSHHWNENSRTQVFLQNLFAQHQPKLWVFGHHHKSFDQVVNGTRFVCLAELEIRDLNI